MHKLYRELAGWWPLLSPPEDYAEEATFYMQLFSQAGLPPAPTLLELGSGGGSNAVHLKKHFFQVTLCDISPDMLAISRALNPDCEHVEGDMRTIRLGRKFDVVFVHDAIEYMTTPQDLRLAMGTVYLHCKAGGLALFAPDHVRETFQPSTEHGGSDSDERGLRYLEWSYDPVESDTTYTTQYVYILRERRQVVRVENEEHICGLFPRETWINLLGAVGFLAEIVPDPYEREVFLAKKPKA